MQLIIRFVVIKYNRAEIRQKHLATSFIFLALKDTIALLAVITGLLLLLDQCLWLACQKSNSFVNAVILTSTKINEHKRTMAVCHNQENKWDCSWTTGQICVTSLCKSQSASATSLHGSAVVYLSPESECCGATLTQQKNMPCGQPLLCVQPPPQARPWPRGVCCQTACGDSGPSEQASMPAALKMKSPGLDRAISSAAELELNVRGMRAGKDQPSSQSCSFHSSQGKDLVELATKAVNIDMALLKASPRSLGICADSHCLGSI